MHHVKRLYRSRTNKVFAGICGGLGEYFEVDPVVVRVGWVVVSTVTGVLPGILAYIIAIFIIPEQREIKHTHHQENN
jgi:phage shock protein C